MIVVMSSSGSGSLWLPDPSKRRELLAERHNGTSQKNGIFSVLTARNIEVLNFARRIVCSQQTAADWSAAAERHSECGSQNSNKLTKQMQQFHKFITWLFCAARHVSGAFFPSSGAYDSINSLWFYRWRVVVAVLLVVVWPAGQTTTNNAATTALQSKTRGC